MEKWRLDFPFFNTSLNKQIVYLDNAATTQKPQAVIDAIVHFYTYDNANAGRGIYALGERATILYESARRTVANFISAHDPSEIVFTSGATESINMVAHAWALNNLTAGDEIAVTQLEHHANLLPWQWVAQKTGAHLKHMPLTTQQGDLDYSSLDTIITNKTRLIAVTHVSNALGTTVDINLLTKKAHAVGARILVDASQSIAHRRINIDKLNIDFLAFSAHKMFGPMGIGVLYVKKEVHAQLIPYRLGGGMVYSALSDSATWQPMPHMLEAGTAPLAQAVGLAAAINYLQAINFDQIQEHEAKLCARTINGLSRLPYIHILGPVEQLKKEGHIVAFVVEGMHAHDVAAYLDMYGICVRAGHHCAQPLAHVLGYDASVRVSFSLYSTYAEVNALLNALVELKESGFLKSV